MYVNVINAESRINAGCGGVAHKQIKESTSAQTCSLPLRWKQHTGTWVVPFGQFGGPCNNLVNTMTRDRSLSLIITQVEFTVHLINFHCQFSSSLINAGFD